MRDETFFCIDEINQRIFVLLDEHNRLPMQKREYSRHDRFNAEELPLLLSLPGDPFIIKHTAQAKVAPNYHVLLGEDWHHYSAPYIHMGNRYGS